MYSFRIISHVLEAFINVMTPWFNVHNLNFETVLLKKAAVTFMILQNKVIFLLYYAYEAYERN